MSGLIHALVIGGSIGLAGYLNRLSKRLSNKPVMTQTPLPEPAPLPEPTLEAKRARLDQLAKEP